MFINMDETALAYSYPNEKGTVIVRKWLPRGRKHRKQKLSLAELRGHITLIAFITPDPAVQASLPQILLGSEHKFTKTLLREVRDDVPNNVHVWAAASSWNNQRTMGKILRLLAKHLEGLMDTYQPVLVLDVASCHVSRALSLLATRLGLRLIYVPARLTGLLQPADTHLFRMLKSYVRSQWADTWSENQGRISERQWLNIIFDCVKYVLRGNRWRSAFEEDGLLSAQRKLGETVLSELGVGSVDIGNSKPTLAQLSLVFRKRTKVANLELFRDIKPLPKVKAKPEAKSAASSHTPSGTTPGPISMHTRSKSKGAVRMLD